MKVCAWPMKFNHVFVAFKLFSSLSFEKNVSAFEPVGLVAQYVLQVFVLSSNHIYISFSVSAGVHCDKCIPFS